VMAKKFRYIPRKSDNRAQAAWRWFCREVLYRKRWFK
jgi:hypothetical protein